jgi:ribosomal-protein-alanine N-acetyltransferase
MPVVSVVVCRQDACAPRELLTHILDRHPSTARLGFGIVSGEMASVEIQKLQNPDDAEWCAQVMTSSEPWMTLGRSYQQSLRIITDSSREVYLCLVEGAAAGFVILNMTGAFVGYIQTICIAPEYRSKGVGSRLLEFAEHRIFKESPNVFICVSSFNDRAHRLYERAGYETIGELSNYLVKGHSEILMRKSLGPWKDYQGHSE